MSDRSILGMVTAMVLVASVSATGAGRQEGLRPLGFVAASGDVRVDSQPAPSGTALFAGDLITTGSASAAVMNFQSGTAATLAAGGEVALSGDVRATAMSLKKGTMAVRNEGREPARVGVLGATVLVQGEDGFPAMCRIAFVGGTAGIFAERGRIEVHGKGAPVVLAPGKHLQLAAGGPQAAGQPAGKVANEIPEGTIQHAGQTAELPLKVADSIVWEDTVRTLKMGRVRIALLDGSFLNVGARSIMKITKHDAQTQQTQVELQLGRLRGEVVKITKPGGGLQVRTQTAVIGVVGTILNIQALRSLTRVFCVDGTVTVRNLNPAIPGEVTLHPGQTTSVPRGAPPSGASAASGSQVSSEVGQTNAGEPLSGELSQAMQSIGAAPAQAGAAAGQAAGGGVHLSATVANGISTAAGAASAGLAGAAISRAGDAKDLAGQANDTFAGAASSSEAAAQDAANAAETATNVTEGVQILIEELSPGGPGCTCL